MPQSALAISVAAGSVVLTITISGSGIDGPSKAGEAVASFGRGSLIAGLTVISSQLGTAAPVVGGPPAAAPCSLSTTIDIATTGAGELSDGPAAYANSATCAWLITATTASQVELTFSFFSLEMGYDFVKLYDGTGSASPVLASLSGTITPAPYRSSSSSLYVVFTSDSSVSAAGFVAGYRSVSGGSTPAPQLLPTLQPQSTVTPPVSDAPCSGSTALTAPTGSLSDGPGDYSNGMSCTWQITASSAVLLSFSQFNTESGYDWVPHIRRP